MRILTPFRILGLVSLFVIGLLFGGIAPASAHSGLVSSDPRDGAQLAAPPAKVTLVFEENLLPDFVNFSISNAAGAPLSITGVKVDGATAVLPWPTDAPGDTYTVAYRVVSEDGHPVSGSITFAYVSPSPTPTPSTSSATPSPTSSSAAPTTSAPDPDPTQTPTPDPTNSGTSTPTQSPDVNPVSSSSSTGWIIAGAAIVVLAIIAIVALIARRR